MVLRKFKDYSLYASLFFPVRLSFAMVWFEVFYFKGRFSNKQKGANAEYTLYRMWLRIAAIIMHLILAK